MEILTELFRSFFKNLFEAVFSGFFIATLISVLLILLMATINITNSMIMMRKHKIIAFLDMAITILMIIFSFAQPIFFVFLILLTITNGIHLMTILKIKNGNKTR